MTPERWQQIADLVEEVVELEPAHRSTFLDQACSADPSLRREVEALLDSEKDVLSGFLQSPPMSEGLIANLHNAVSPSALQSGHVLAERFRLLRKLGEGGMGQVWLAEQTAPVRRQVALKLIKAGMYDETIVERFQAERQSLAIMDHPAIAKVFDAGTTQQGQPYFVMEYVPGLPITEYCDQKKLKIKDRLELFIQACEGVQHAHQKAIIHRDLKPANILVVEVDGKPVPRIIDFGLAKASTPQAEGQSIFTQIGHFVGTPGYMSPEQADPQVKDIDTRTDVYSLGAILYVLLSGARPFDPKAEEKLPLDELLRRMREEEPPTPSEKVSLDRDTSTATADARGTDARQLVSVLRGDLDWITMKALEKDRARRYGTPTELAADLRRYLNNEPVVARPAGTAYRIRKYVRRHGIAVAAAASAVAVLAAFAVFQKVELTRITRERDRANRITDFMTDMFKVADPSETRGNQVTAREILDKASNNIEKSLTKDPELQARLMYAMGNVYASLGLNSRSESLLRQSLDLQSRTLGAEHPDTLDSASSLGRTLRWEGKNPEAEKLLRSTVQAEQRVLGPEDPRTLRSINGLANTLAYEGKNSEAEPLLSNVLKADRRLLGPEHPDTLKAMRDLSIVLREEGHYAQAEQLQKEAVAIHLRVFGTDHADTLAAMVSLGNTLWQEGRLAEAEKLVRQIVDIEVRLFGPEHPDTLNSQYNLAAILADEGKNADAEKLLQETLDKQTRALGPDAMATLRSKCILGEIQEKLGRLAEAEETLRAALAGQNRILGPEHPNSLVALSDLGEVLDEEGKYPEAERLQRKAYELRARVPGGDPSDTLYSMAALAVVLSHMKRFPEAEDVLRQAQEIRSHTPDLQPTVSAKIGVAVAAVASQQGRREEALKTIAQLLEQNPSAELVESLETDKNLSSIRGDARFARSLADAKQRVKKQGH